MKLLFSWVAFNNDFEQGQVNINGPTMTFHRHFFRHDRHFLLSSGIEDDLRLRHLVNKLALEFPDRNEIIEPVYMNILDVIDLDEVKSKIETLLLKYREDDIDIFFSPGTSIMQLSWFICHTNLGLKTRLLQTRSAKFSTDRSKVDIMEITVDKSSTPVTAIVKEQLLNNKSARRGQILYTDSIEPVYQKAYRIAQTDSVTTLIYGASGTGKENLANYIHENSVRKNHPFITVNCSAMGDSLLESRLFGYKKGSFTGADKDTGGLFEEAEDGTIFLDEIGDISPYMQQSLLRVFQSREIQPIGGKTRKINVRIISATNKDLKKLCSSEKFRWDLYYRLSITELELPTLSERGADEKKLFINHFLALKKKQFQRSNKINISPDAMKSIMNYSFPGNIRELENLIEGLYVYHDDKVELHDIPLRLKTTEPEVSLRWIDAEKLHILKVLKHFHGNKSRSCEAMGYGSINTLVKKMRIYGIEDSDYLS
jgi:transcriptional regulator with PAS, ATPase and Fis domain